MREILFRGKRIDNGEWIKGFFVLCVEKHFIATGRTVGFLLHDEGYEVHPETAGQFTGLVDKHNNKIFEGDIVENIATKGLVIYEKGMFACSTSAKVNFGQRQPLCYVDDWEIIGNIHGDSHLLKEGV